MSKAFSEVQVGDFSKITIERLPHQEIENALIAIGGGGVSGTKFKMDIMKAAGWKKGHTSSYASSPEIAVAAFNKIRQALMSTDDAAKLLAKVSEGE